MPENRCGAEKARQTLPALLERAHRGGVTIITRHGVPYAALVPVEARPTEDTAPSVMSLRDTGRGLWIEEPAAHIARMLDEWD